MYPSWYTVRCLRLWRYCSSLAVPAFSTIIACFFTLSQFPPRGGLTLSKPLSNFPQESSWAPVRKILFFPFPPQTLSLLGPWPVCPLILREGVRRRESKWMRARSCPLPRPGEQRVAGALSAALCEFSQPTILITQS